MNQHTIVETTIYVVCPLYDRVQKVYARSIPEQNIHLCNGCDNISGSKVCDNCIYTLIALLRKGKIKVASYSLDDLLNKSSVGNLGTSTNPLWLK